MHKRFGNTTITANLQWGASALWKRDEQAERIAALERELAAAQAKIDALTKDADCVRVQIAFLAALRPAVAEQVTRADRSLLKWEHAEFPPYYGDALKRDAEEWNRRLYQLDAAIDAAMKDK